MKLSKPKFVQFIGDRNYLSGISLPVILFFWCDWQQECQIMCSLIETLIGEYKDEDVVFYWVNADEHENICREFSVPYVPTVLIFKDNEEITRFICRSSQAGIRHHLDELVKAMKNPRKPALPVPSFQW